VILVRLRDQQDPVVLLNQKLGELNAEITRRIRTEGALLASEAALRSRATEAEALNRAKDEFLATVSHELRTPLNAILGWVDLLRKRPVNPEVDRAAAVIHRNAKAQAKLIEDLIDVSRIISGKFRIEPHDCDLVTLIDDALATIRASAEAKQLELTREVPEPGCAVFGDAARIRQVLGNLLSNALKFSETGGRIHVGLRADAETVTLSISDSGSGIEPAFLPFVFERFKQADGSNTRHVGGLGLGLALVRHIVEAHGGAVEARSDGKDRGATFVVTLPIRAVATPPSVSSYSVDVAGLAAPTPGASAS
jgi:signal transduction histidine kinase